MLQIGDKLIHRILRHGRIALPMPAQIWRHNPRETHEVVDLIFPSLGNSGVAVDEQQSLFCPFRTDVDDAKIGIRQTGDWNIDPVKVKVKLDSHAF